MRLINSFVNRITMYRLTLYVLISYIVIAVFESFAGILTFDPVNIITQAVYLALICQITNKLFAKFFNATTNTESALITALILALIVGPVDLSNSIFFLTIVGIAAMASKYILAVRKRHVFNPAAIAVIVSAIIINNGASWWIGSRPMFLPILIGGVLILAKIKRFTMALTFLIPYWAYFIYLGLTPQDVLFQSVAIFFATIMLIEPLTTPENLKQQVAYAGLVGALYILYQQTLGVSYTLEIALISGNLFSYLLTRPFRVNMILEKKKEIANHIFAFYLRPEREFDFIPGQFMHWTLPHKNVDSRGIRRYFTIASSPTEEQIMIAVKVPNEHSSYKSELKELNEGDKIEAMDLAGEFTLHENKQSPLCFIAGGIGVTPYRSFIKYLLDEDQKRDIVLLYSVSQEDEIAFKDLFKKAEKIGLKSYFIETEKDEYINEEMIKEKVTDYKDRIFYISGPQPMVEAFEKMLKEMDVKNIKTDFFPGYTEKYQK